MFSHSSLFNYHLAITPLTLPRGDPPHGEMEREKMERVKKKKSKSKKGSKISVYVYVCVCICLYKCVSRRNTMSENKTELTTSD